MTSASGTQRLDQAGRVPHVSDPGTKDPNSTESGKSYRWRNVENTPRWPQTID